MVGAETASTAGTSLWDSTAPDGTCATDVVPSPNPRCLPGWSRALPTLQEWGSTVVATTHLACALSLSRCLTPSDCAHMARTCLFVIWTSATCTAYHASPVSPVSLGIVLSPHMQVVFALFWCLLGQALPLVSDRMAPCPINPSLSVLGSDQASLCLARAFLSPWGGRGNDVIASYQKKKEMRMLVHCPIYLAFSITMLWCAHQGNCLFFLHCRSTYYVACRCLWLVFAHFSHLPSFDADDQRWLLRRVLFAQVSECNRQQVPSNYKRYRLSDRLSECLLQVSKYTGMPTETCCCRWLSIS